MLEKVCENNCRVLLTIIEKMIVSNQLEQTMVYLKIHNWLFDLFNDINDINDRIKVTPF